MGQKVLLLGHGKKSGLRLARLVADCGHRPLAAAWDGFSPRAFGRDRPGVVLADMDAADAPDMARFCGQLRKGWGEAFPVIAVSRSRRFRDVSALIDAGADDCLSPEAPAALVERKLARCLDADGGSPADELAEEIPDALAALFAGRSELVRLGDVASVHAGATPRRPAFRRMAPPDDDWRGVMTAGVVERFYAGKPEAYLRWSRLHLFRLPSPAEYSVAEKVLVKRAGPPIIAAVDRSRLPAGADMYSLVPHEGVGAGYLACLLNSRLLDFYFNRLANTGADGRLRPEDLRETPIPRPTAAAMQELARAAALLAHYGPNPETWIDRQSKDELWEQMESAVFTLYGADAAVRGELAALHF